MRKRVTVVGEGPDEIGNRYLLLTVDGKGFPPIPVADISDSGSFIAKLKQNGANIFTSKSRNEVLRDIESYKAEKPSFRVVTRVGWVGLRYALPDKIFGTGKTPIHTIFDNLGRAIVEKYRVKGSLTAWQSKIAALCTGNSRLMFAASLGLTGPILRYAEEPKLGGFQLVGPGETGKTTAAMVAGSLWGCHKDSGRREIGFAEHWHTTGGESGGKIEITALAHNDTVLILDETKLTSAKTVLDAAFALAEGAEKERLNASEPARSWRFYFLTTSNHTLDELGEAARMTVDDARRGRLVEIPLPEQGDGIYEDLHGLHDGRALTDRLKARCRTYFGAPSREYLRRLVTEARADKDRLKKFLRAERKTYLAAIEKSSKQQGLKPLNRASGRFATVFAAGSLAIRYGIFPWSRQILLRAILACQMDGLTMPIGKPKPEQAPAVSARRKLIEWLQEHRHEFMNLDKKAPRLGKHEFGSVPGYSATFKNKKWFYLTADQFREITGGGESAEQLKKDLADDKLLVKASNDRYVVQRPVFSGAAGNKGFRSVHALKVVILKEQC